MNVRIAETLELIQRPFAAEKKSGCANKVVIGGLDTYVLNHARALLGLLSETDQPGTDLVERLVLLMTSYGGVSPSQRARLLDDAAQIVNRLKAREGEAEAGKEARHVAGTEAETVSGTKAETVSGTKASHEAEAQRLSELALEATTPLRGDGSDLEKPVTAITGVAKSRAVELEKLGLKTVEDVLYHLPRRYEDMSQVVAIKDVRAGDRVTVCGRVLASKETMAKSRRGLLITKAVIGDDTGQLNVIWFGAGWRSPSPLLKRLRDAEEIIVHGEAESDGGALIVKNPAWDLADRDSLHVGRVVPVYAGTGKLPAKILRRIVHQAVETFADGAPQLVPRPGETAGGKWSLGTTLRRIHSPSAIAEAEAARRQICLEEVFLLQVALQRRRWWRMSEARGIEFKPVNELTDKLLRHLPFELTPAQRRVLDEVYRDMAKPVPMERLVLGDVGSGKTVIAAAALLRAVENGFQGALMAPTEILAEQHYATLSRFCEKLPVTVSLVTGGTAKKAALSDISDGKADITVGTHALIQEKVVFQNLGLVVADEQHRFGVRQRQLLASKGQAPDVLVMSATPIPRTLALTVYGDLEVSVIDGAPPGRKPVTTKWVKENGRSKVYDFLRKELDRGHQAYLVCPLVEESDELEAKAATAEAKRLAATEFQGYSVGLLHGQLNAAEKESVMRGFRDGQYRLLVTTSVVEVGVDVPNATVMVVENAERFGLAQLHQLRGRVGRGEEASYCVLISEGSSFEAKKRLTAMTEISDGFRLAEEDLALRGPGEFFGTRQSGLPELRLPVAELLGDPATVKAAREIAARLLESDPSLEQPGNHMLRRCVSRRFGEVLPILS